jgi:hypothetical protein
MESDKLGSCRSDGTLHLAPQLARTVADDRRAALEKLPRGTVKAKAYLEYADFCSQNGLERMAVDAYWAVMRLIPWHSRGEKRLMLDEACRGLEALCGCADEYVWEIASQVSGEYRRYLLRS